MDFDTVEERNLDRLLGATTTDAWLRRAKVQVARRLVIKNTALRPDIEIWEHSICEPAGRKTSRPSTSTSSSAASTGPGRAQC